MPHIPPPPPPPYNPGEGPGFLLTPKDLDPPLIDRAWWEYMIGGWIASLGGWGIYLLLTVLL